MGVTIVFSALLLLYVFKLLTYSSRYMMLAICGVITLHTIQPLT